MAILPFDDFAPDAPDFRNPSATFARNVIPLRGGYGPWPDLASFTSALDSRARGAVETYDRGGTPHQYAGDAAKLYELDASFTWQDVSATGGYSTASTENWEFARWENTVIATNYSDNPQVIDMAGGDFSELTSAFRAKALDVVRDFVVFGNTVDSSDGDVHDRIRWSAINDSTDYTVSPTTLSDFRDLKVGGAILKIIGGEIGVILSERSIFRMQFVGAPTVFQIEEILRDIGPLSPGCVTTIGNTVFALTNRGFFALDSSGRLEPLGAGRVDEFALAQIDMENRHRITSAADPDSNRVLFAIPGLNSQGGTPNIIMLYDRNFDKWSFCEQEVELLNRAQGVGVSLDDLPTIGYTNIDAMDVSLDSRFWKDFTEHMAAFNTSHEMGVFRGTGKPATLTTREIEPIRGQRSLVKGARPMVDAPNVSPTVTLGTRNALTDNVKFGSAKPLLASGGVALRGNGRFHRFRVDIPAGNWRNAVGVQLTNDDAKRAGRR